MSVRRRSTAPDTGPALTGSLIVPELSIIVLTVVLLAKLLLTTSNSTATETSVASLSSQGDALEPIRAAQAIERHASPSLERTAVLGASLLTVSGYSVQCRSASAGGGFLGSSGSWAKSHLAPSILFRPTRSVGYRGLSEETFAYGAALSQMRTNKQTV